MIFDTLMKVPLLAQILGLAFIACILIAVIDFGYRTEEMGDEEQ